MPRLGVLELPSILQKRLVAHHDHMALTFEVQVCLIVLSPWQRFDGALGIADLQLQGLFDKRIDRLLGNLPIQPRYQVGDEVVDVEDHPFAIDPPHPFDPGDEAASFGLNVLHQRAFQRELAELHHFGTDVVAEGGVGLAKADDTAELELDGVG